MSSAYSTYTMRDLWIAATREGKKEGDLLWMINSSISGDIYMIYLSVYSKNTDTTLLSLKRFYNSPKPIEKPLMMIHFKHYDESNPESGDVFNIVGYDEDGNHVLMPGSTPDDPKFLPVDKFTLDDYRIFEHVPRKPSIKDPNFYGFLLKAALHNIGAVPSINRGYDEAAEEIMQIAKDSKFHLTHEIEYTDKGFDERSKYKIIVIEKRRL